MRIPLDVLRTLPGELLSVRLNGKIVRDFSTLKEDDLYDVRVRLLGGKGGFGSLLRSFGSQFYKSSNQEMCRDLNGRRLKKKKDSERAKKYVELLQERRKKRKANMEAKLKRLRQKPKHNLQDEVYNKTKQIIMENTEVAIEQGLKKMFDQQFNGDGAKTKVENDKDKKDDVPKLKGSLWLGLDDMSDSECEA